MIVFSNGRVTVTPKGGRPALLSKGRQIAAGDLITTAAMGRTQVRFSDGTYLPVSPDSDIRVHAYCYGGAQDVAVAADFTLFRGTVRCLTGAIGRLESGACG